MIAPDPFAKFGNRPPPASGIGRFMPYMRGMVAGGALVGAGVMIATVLLPDGFRPGDLAGRAAGGAVKHELLESTAALVDRERRIEDAKAQAQAKAQADLAVVTAAITERTQSLAPLSAFAGLADIACLGARIVTGFGPSRDVQEVANNTAQAACGLGDPMRDMVQRSQLQAAQAAAAGRGMALTDASVSAHPAQPQAPQKTAGRAIRNLEDVYAITAISRVYTPTESGEAAQALERFPEYIGNRIRAGLTQLTPDAARNLFTERVRVLVAFTGK